MPRIVQIHSKNQCSAIFYIQYMLAQQQSFRDAFACYLCATDFLVDLHGGIPAC